MRRLPGKSWEAVQEGMDAIPVHPSAWELPLVQEAVRAAEHAAATAAPVPAAPAPAAAAQLPAVAAAHPMPVLAPAVVAAVEAAAQAEPAAAPSSGQLLASEPLGALRSALLDGSLGLLELGDVTLQCEFPFACVQHWCLCSLLCRLLPRSAVCMLPPTSCLLPHQAVVKAYMKALATAQPQERLKGEELRVKVSCRCNATQLLLLLPLLV